MINLLKITANYILIIASILILWVALLFFGCQFFVFDERKHCDKVFDTIYSLKRKNKKLIDRLW